MTNLQNTKLTSSSVNVFHVIVCGGSGTRLWPLSRSDFPKQFLVLSDGESSLSLFQQALYRARAIGEFNAENQPILIVSNEDYRFLILDQLRELECENVTMLLEPGARNTAPALTLAALCAQEQGDDPILLIAPADQTIQNQSAFKKAMRSALEIAQSGAIATLGVIPTAPETGFGYIKAEEMGDLGMHVERFIEKPDVAKATNYFEEGGYYWNSGIFILKASIWLAALQKFRPDILEASVRAWSGKTSEVQDGTIFIRPDRELFQAIPSQSIDYAVIEKCPGSSFSIQMVPLDAGWNDLGAWDAVWQTGVADYAGNVTRGDVLLDQTTNSLVFSTSRLVTAVGVKDLVIVETADAVLVANRVNSQEVKVIVSRLEEAGREEKNFHRKVNRPWGWYDKVDEGERFKVKRIQVKPGASLSLQMHHHRAEHWIVVKGTAEVTIGDQLIILHENQSTYIPQGHTHRLANSGTELLEIIEVQSGSYLGEDDIVRFEDTYGRT